MTDIGFSGTRHGMTSHQATELRKMLIEWRPRLFRHGDCIGADAQAHALVRELVPDCVIIIHPPHDSKWRAYCDGDSIENPAENLARNRAIVNGSEMLIATPQTNDEILRSGTWSTIRYARKKLGEDKVQVIPAFI